jgi:cytochrome c
MWLIIVMGTVGAEALDGEALYIKHQCHICHGEQGRHPTVSGYPIVAGQDRRYLIRQITDIRDGVRDNGQTNLMRPLVKLVTDTEIIAIAKYLSAQ